MNCSSSGSKPITNDGSPEIFFPFGAITIAEGELPEKSKIAPAARATPGVALISSSIDTGSVGALDSDQSTTGFPETTTSVCS